MRYVLMYRLYTTMLYHLSYRLYIPVCGVYISSCKSMFFLRITQVHAKHARTLTPINTLRKSYPYEHLRKSTPTYLDIDEVTIGVDKNVATIKSTIPLNPKINSEKYEHPRQVENLNPVGQVLPQET